MPLFNPFDKPLDEIVFEDLDQLSENGVAEGFYVEYKEQMPSNKQVAKGVSSFANTDGGLFFLGIKDDDEDNVPVAFPGLDISGKVETKEKLRNVLKGRISPPPNFKSRLIHNPHEEEQAVAMLSVPKSYSTPHITNDGRIYRRLGEGSDPYKFATEAKVIDELTNRRESWDERVEQFCQPDLGFTPVQDDWSFLELYGVPSTLGERVCPEVLEDLEGFRDQLSQTKIEMKLGDESERVDMGLTVGKTMDSVRTTSNGVVAHIWNRDVSGEIDTALTPTTFAFYADGGMRCLLPMSIIDASHDSSSAYHEVNTAVEGSLHEIDFIDGLDTVLNIYTIYHAYLGLLERYGWFESEGTNLDMKANINNIYRSLLFFTSDWYVDYIRDFGPPICYENIVSIPRSGTFPLPFNRSERAIVGFDFLVRILEGFGISSDTMEEVIVDMLMMMQKLSD